MQEERGFQDQPLDFTRGAYMHRCPYCGEIIASEELEEYLAPESNTFVCPSCRKRLNIHELGSGM